MSYAILECNPSSWNWWKDMAVGYCRDDFFAPFHQDQWLVIAESCAIKISDEHHINKWKDSHSFCAQSPIVVAEISAMVGLTKRMLFLKWFGHGAWYRFFLLCLKILTCDDWLISLILVRWRVSKQNFVALLFLKILSTLNPSENWDRNGTGGINLHFEILKGTHFLGARDVRFLVRMKSCWRRRRRAVVLCQSSISSSI
jgi:hypothetical protein